MKRILGLVAMSVLSCSASAAGTLVPANQATDMAHDDVRNIIYIASGSQVLRYQLSSGTFASPIAVGGSIRGIDISPDSRSLVVSDDGYNEAGICVHIVDLDSLAQQLACTPAVAPMESGTSDAVYGANGKIFTTVAAFNMYDAPLRSFDPASGQWEVLTQVTPRSQLVASGDAQNIGFTAYPYGGPAVWGFVDVPTGLVVRRQFTQSRNASAIAIDRFGAQFAVLGEDAEYLFDDAYAPNGGIAGNWMGCLAFHPVERLSYVCPYGGQVVNVNDTNTLALVGSVDFGGPIPQSINFSRDGSLMLGLFNDGVRYYQQYSPLQASAMSVTANLNQAKAISLAASLGNGRPIEFSIASLPAHGAVSLSGGTATYTPAAGYLGADSFSYRVQYGRATRTATVSLAVIDPNRAPVAVNDAAQTRTTAVLIPVLANDSDPDGDPLSLVSVTVPSAGAAVIQGGKILFTPPKQWPKTAITFSYTISDGHGKTATASVAVTRN